MEKNLNDYLEKIEKYLKPLPISERGDIVKEIKSEILELQSDGKTAEQITGRLGNPKELAKAYVGERGNYLCLAQKHTGNISCIRSTAFARPLYALRHSNAWRDRSRWQQKEISLEYLTEEKFYPLGTTDEYFEAPYEEYPITICGQTIILTNGELAAALLSLPERNREIIFLYFFGDYTQQEIGEMYGRCRSTTGYQIRRTLQLLHKEMEVLSHGESEPFTL